MSYIPLLPTGYVSATRSYWQNGRVVNNDNTDHHSDRYNFEKGDKPYYFIYRSLDEALNEINQILENDISFGYIIYDHTGKEIDFPGEYYSPLKYIYIFNKCLKDWGQPPIFSNKYFNYIPLETWKANLFFRHPNKDYIKYNFLLEYHTFTVYIDEDKDFKISLKINEINKNNSLLYNLFSTLFLSLIQIKKYPIFDIYNIIFYNYHNKSLKKLRCYKSVIPMRHGYHSSYKKYKPIYTKKEITLNAIKPLSVKQVQIKMPKLVNGFYSVLRIRITNAAVVNNDNTNLEIGQVCLENNGKPYYRLYQSLVEAKNEISFLIADDSSYGYFIYDSDGRECDYIVPTTY